MEVVEREDRAVGDPVALPEHASHPGRSTPRYRSSSPSSVLKTASVTITANHPQAPLKKSWPVSEPKNLLEIHVVRDRQPRDGDGPPDGECEQERERPPPDLSADASRLRVPRRPQHRAPRTRGHSNDSISCLRRIRTSTNCQTRPAVMQTNTDWMSGSGPLNWSFERRDDPREHAHRDRRGRPDADDLRASTAQGLRCSIDLPIASRRRIDGSRGDAGRRQRRLPRSPGRCGFQPSLGHALKMDLLSIPARPLRHSRETGNWGWGFW